MSHQKKILFVRSGGGAPGIDIHVGIWLALEEGGIRPTALSGTSAGAVVSALHASGRTALNAESILRDLTDTDIRDPRFAWQIRLPWIDSIHSADRLRNLLARMLPDLPNPDIDLAIWATRSDGAKVNVWQPDITTDLRAAVMASCSISGLFPAVILRNSRDYFDGGVRCNLPLPPDWTTYDEVYLLVATGAPNDYQQHPGLITSLLRNLGWLMLDQIDDVLDDVFQAQKAPTNGKPLPAVYVIWPELHTGRGLLHFDHNLIATAYQEAKRILNRNRDEGVFGSTLAKVFPKTAKGSQ